METKFLNIEVVERPCYDYGCDKSRVPYLHYPKPETFSRAECACNPVRFFAIISMQRYSPLKRGGITCLQLWTLWIGFTNLDWYSSASKNHCSAAVGFKWMLNQGLMEHHNEIVEYFNSRNVSVIFLFRRNLLRRMVSVLANSYDRYAKLLNGTHKSHVHSPAEAEMLSKYKPTINSASLMNDLKEMEVTAAKSLEHFRSTRHIILYYEDLISNCTKLEEVQEFLKLPLMNLTSRQVKIHKGPMREHIKNWEDVNKTLQGTTYESFLRADY
ncbi:P-loop containing nucleoside triphosphate hydrolases superfamily protein [Actinidia rufa]|uniref:P-loop containing nucleoside triphosphate hydrolases superfamily protein n=1 Tax=Actinidia rufa TaxID=165716 RepID=A0A7J0H6M0_9ERIC|nr:P-loop containing nucleoside triphosphate hydrolases superfamily protein [Actinidia rufa]